MQRKIRSVCVFCGSRSGKNPAFTTAAQEFGRWLAETQRRLVYGAGDVGLNGETARACQQAGGETFGVIPVHLMEREVGKHDLSHFVVTETMHERKKVMFMNCDAIVVLPGAAGSLDEFYEVVTWRQLGLHAKPVCLLNIDGYWDPLISLNAHVVDQGFAEASLLDFVTVTNTLDALKVALSEAS